ncbi:hypothetical protein TNCT_311821 [Trichonephila clavata]|uniref:Uncharacterized protein n=1 Tax=Trichonephila clavata TaxID=2740835 RepID=A0A8X6LJS1_TRICU|nr:hypothetical protein TNCT_311821 [Trichonephila clavata]
MNGLSIFSPKNNGWTLEDNQHPFNWFDGDQLPAFISESLQDESVSSKDADDDYEDIQHQYCIDDEISNFIDNNNEE